MRNYREHLRVPASYWVLGFITMATFASIVWAGFSLLIGVVCYVVLVGLPGVALLIAGEKTISVADGELRAGRVVLPLGRAGQVQALDEKQTAQLRGPLADPAAYLLVRPYLLIGSRHPEELAAAIDTRRPQPRAGDPSVA
jgi:hypothetical protein